MSNMEKFICVKVDTNDADNEYIFSLREVKDESHIEIVKKIWLAVDEIDNDGYGHGDVFDGDISYLTDQFTEEEMNIFDMYMPNSVNGFHSICEISLITGIKKNL